MGPRRPDPPPDGGRRGTSPQFEPVPEGVRVPCLGPDRLRVRLETNRAAPTGRDKLAGRAALAGTPSASDCDAREFTRRSCG
ncbi:hypothetical protein GCM10010363_46030 [Streptomyces omiyaensis]|nr:hypothetical protein GCM10010363_46030 [Streptomyces omiyaensis]